MPPAGNARVQLILDAIDKTTEPIRRVNRRIEGMVAPVKKVRRAFRSLAKEAGLPKLAAGARAAGRAFARLGAVGAAAVGGLVAAATKAAGAGDDIAKLSKQVGISAEALQELRFAADRSGVPIETFDKSIGALSKRVGELKRGGGALAPFAAVLPNVVENLKNAGSTGEALEIVNQAIANLEDPAKKSALAAAAFSRAGLPMITLANEGAEGMRELRAEARRLGAVLSNEDAAAAEEANDRLTDLKAAVRGLTLQLGAGLFPVLVDIVKPTTEWIVANRELIRTRVTEMVQNLVRVGSGMVRWLADVVPPTLEWLSSIGGLRTVAIVLGGVLAAVVIPAIVAVGAALGPVGVAVAAAIAGWTALATVVSSNWDAIATFVETKVQRIVELARSVVSSIPEPIRAALGLATGPIGSAALNFLGGDSAETASSTLAAPAAGPAQANVAGRIVVELDNQGQARAVAAESSPGLELGLEGGGVLAPI